MKRKKSIALCLGTTVLSLLLSGCNISDSSSYQKQTIRKYESATGTQTQANTNITSETNSITSSETVTTVEKTTAPKVTTAPNTTSPTSTTPLTTTTKSPEKSSTATISKLIESALMPVGQTLYVWGGGWNEQDNGSGETAVNIGVYSKWKEFYDSHKNGHSMSTYKAQWDSGNRESRFYGLDCSGYIGWAVYNTVETENNKAGYVTYAETITQTLAQKAGFGTVKSCDVNTKLYPGDIVSLNAYGHTWISLGQCSDGSALLLHSTAEGGVQLSGTASNNGEANSEAYKLAKSYMQKYYPDWWKYFGDKKTFVTNTNRIGTVFSWNVKSGVVSDTENIRNMTPEQILKRFIGQ